MNTPDSNDLIDLSLADDALLPPSLTDEFVGFRLSVSERKSCEARLHQATIRNVNKVVTQSQSNYYEPDRKSLTWHTAFLTNDGILDAEELMLYNRGLRKKDLQKKPEQRKIVSRSCSMPRVPAKRIATEESAEVHKKPRSWLSTSVRSSFVQSSSSSGSSMKNMLKSSISFLKKKVGSESKASSASFSSFKFPSDISSTKSKANSIGSTHPGRKSKPKVSTSSNNRTLELTPSTPPCKETSRFYAEGLKISAQSISCSFSLTPTKETVFCTPGSRPSGLRLPSARFGFFDFEQSSSSRWEETFYTAPKSTPQETITKVDSSFQTPVTTSSATRAVKKLRNSVLTPVPYLPTPNYDADDKENRLSIEARVDDLSKHLSSIDLETDIATDLQVKKGSLTSDQVTTPPLKQAVLTQRKPLAAHNRSLYSSTSSRY